MTSGCLSKASKRHRRELLRARRAASASSKVPGASLGKRPAGAVVGLDPPAPQMRGDPAGKIAVGGDQGGGPARLLERLAKGDGDRLRFLGRIGELERAHAGQPALGRAQILPFGR